MENYDEVIQKYLSEKYDKEFEDLKAIVEGARELGKQEGKKLAKFEIINMLQGEKE
jgi:hypothetical protein